MKWWFILILLLIPTFSLMLKPGIYTMHDFHLFRLQQFDKCFREGNFPCRWSADASLGYGQPVFNFYGQLVYWLGEPFVLLGLSIIDSTKLLFILSLVLSGGSMLVLARRYWGNLGALISATIYVWAPYRAVDVWVRGALPEAWSFVWYPVIFTNLDLLLLTGKFKYCLGLAISLAALIITHNLSVVMILPFLALWTLFRLIQHFSWHKIYDFISAGLIAFLLAAFYILPVLFESRLITLSSTTQDYYNFKLHFATLKQLFIDRTWGYGGSTWGPNDTMSFAVGYLQWLMPLVITIYFIWRRHWRGLILVGLGLVAIFLTHGKSEIVWTTFKPLAFVQFPWRFLGLGLFFWSLASGAISYIIPRILVPFLLLSLLLLNASFFRPDIWRLIGDSQAFSGELWDEQRSSAKTDFWPTQALGMPESFASDPAILGEGKILNYLRGVQKNKLQVEIKGEKAKVILPIVNFPGWLAAIDGVDQPITAFGKLGLISVDVDRGVHRIDFYFGNTPIRSVGNGVSAFAAEAVVLVMFWKKVWR